MKTRSLTLILLFAICLSCKKDSIYDDVAASIQPSTQSYIDIIPKNNGRFLNLSQNGLRIVIWSLSYNDTICVYNTFDGSLQSTIVHPASFGGYFKNVRLTDDGTKVISEHDNYEIKMWDATTGGFIMNLETVHDWVTMPDGNTIIGFADNLSVREVIKQVSLVTGVMINSDTFPEMIYPIIAGVDQSGNQYTLVEFQVDVNNPGAPVRSNNIIIRDINAHTQIANYNMSRYSFPSTFVMTDDVHFFSVITYDSIQLKNKISFFETVTGNWYSEMDYINNFNTNVSPGPGGDRFVSVSEDGLAIDHLIFTPGTVKNPSKYGVTDHTHLGFQNLDVNKGNTRVAASYEATGGISHVAVWHAFQ